MFKLLKNAKNVKNGANMVKKLNFNTVINKIKTFNIKDKKKIFILLLAIIAICIIFCIGVFDKNKISQNKKSYVSADDYSMVLEQKLESMILGVKDVASVDVFVMVGGSVITNYLMETTETETTGASNSTKTTTTKVVYEKANGGTVPIVVSTSYPEVVGVMVVISGVNSSTKLAIKNSISVVLNIPEERICILQEK